MLNYSVAELRVKIYADTNKNLGDNINGKIQQLET